MYIVARTEGDPASLADDALVVDDPRKQLRAPEVERDDTGGSHGLRLR